MKNLLHLPEVWKLILLVVLFSNFQCPIAVPLWRAKRLLVESNAVLPGEIDTAAGRSRRSGDSDSESESDRDSACRDPGIPENGMRSGSRFHVGSELTFSCEPGFVLRGSTVLTCRYGNEDDPRWDADVPRCVGK